MHYSQAVFQCLSLKQGSLFTGLSFCKTLISEQYLVHVGHLGRESQDGMYKHFAPVSHSHSCRYLRNAGCAPNRSLQIFPDGVISASPDIRISSCWQQQDFCDGDSSRVQMLFSFFRASQQVKVKTCYADSEERWNKPGLLPLRVARESSRKSKKKTSTFHWFILFTKWVSPALASILTG